jgi:hypothetical protein
VGLPDFSARGRLFADVRIDGGDAIRMELEYRERVALMVIVPNSRSRFTKKITLGLMRGAVGQSRVWIR